MSFVSRAIDRVVTTRNVFCAFTAPIPVGHRVEITFFERHVELREGIFTDKTRMERRPVPNEPLVRDLDTGIVYADEIHFQKPAELGNHEQVEAYRASLCRGLAPASDMVAVETIRGRVHECTIIGNLWVYADDRRSHTRLVVELEAAGYRG
jgi:hypothetical protein